MRLHGNKCYSAVTASSLRWPHWCRRAERREDAVAMLRSRGYGREVDLSPAESEGIFLEGTGVLVRPGTSDVVDMVVTVAS